MDYLYYYSGGGVAAGDGEGDGLVDLHFTSNLGKNRLYRNLGSFTALDMEQSGLAIDGQVRQMAFLTRANGERVIVVAKNNDRVQFLRTTYDARRTY